MAWSVISAAYKVCLPRSTVVWRLISHNLPVSQVFLAQVERDNNIQALLVTMDEVYAFVNDTEPLERIESHRQILTRLAQQTIDCGYFICSYAKDKNFCMVVHLNHGAISDCLPLLSGTRAGRHIVGGIDAVICDYQAKFSQLREEFHDRATLHTEIMVLRILDNVENLGM